MMQNDMVVVYILEWSFLGRWMSLSLEKVITGNIYNGFFQEQLLAFQNITIFIPNKNLEL